MKGFLLIDPCGLHPTQEVQPYSLRQSLTVLTKYRCHCQQHYSHQQHMPKDQH